MSSTYFMFVSSDWNKYLTSCGGFEHLSELMVLWGPTALQAYTVFSADVLNIARWRKMRKVCAGICFEAPGTTRDQNRGAVDKYK